MNEGAIRHAERDRKIAAEWDPLSDEAWQRHDAELEKQLAAADADVKAGRVSKPYRSARALMRDALRAGKQDKQPTKGKLTKPSASKKVPKKRRTR